MAGGADPAAGRSRRIRLVGLLAGLLLAAGATVALVLTDDVHTLRLAVIASLWAFLIAAFLVGQRSSNGVASTAEMQLRRTYEAELEREVTARREYELRLEVSLRRELESGLRADVGALRDELQQLRGAILDRWNGELRVETVALRTESTRVSGNLGAALSALQDQAQRRAVGPRSGGEIQRPSVQTPGRRHRYRDDDDSAGGVELAPSDVLDRLRAERDPAVTARPGRRHRYPEDEEAP